MGDWNGCLRISDDQIKVPHRPIWLTPGDTSLQEYVRSQNLVYPIDRMSIPFNIHEHYVESSSGTRVDFYRVIDYIFVSCLDGLFDYTIDSFYDLIADPSNTLQGSIYIDHNVVSIF
jgi:hypothetical protein